MGFITPEIVRLIVPRIHANTSEVIAALCNKICPRYGLDNLDVFHEFFSTVAHESAGFSAKEENLNYSKQGLMKIFGKYFTTLQAEAYARKPEKIANRVYANRMGNGPESSGDGWRFRGSGYIQLTGRDLHKAYADYISYPLDTASELMRTSDEHGFNSACWLFSVVKKLNDEAAEDKFREITLRINGGLIGFEERTAYLVRARKYLPIQNV